ncbi:hypothetical protein ACVILE_005813 [Streptomyces sp. M18.1]
MTAREALAPPAEGPACPASLVSPASLVRAHRKIRR